MGTILSRLKLLTAYIAVTVNTNDLPSTQSTFEYENLLSTDLPSAFFMMNSVYAMCEKYEPQKLEEYRKQVNEIWSK